VRGAGSSDPGGYASLQRVRANGGMAVDVTGARGKRACEGSAVTAFARARVIVARGF